MSGWYNLPGYDKPVYLYEDQLFLWWPFPIVGPFASQELAERHRDYTE